MKKKKNRKKKLQKSSILIAVLLCAIAILFMAILGTTNKKPEASNTKQSLEAYATQVIGRCKDAPYKPSCYDREIPKLMSDISMEDAFKVTRDIQSQDSSYPFCHVLGHDLASAEVKKDPSKWEQVVARCPSGICSNGCIHGAFQERFRKVSLSDSDIQKIIPDLSNICEKRADWNPTGLEQGSCYHAMGHMMMYATNADLSKSLTLCKTIAKKSDGRDFSQLCSDGVFMQIFQPLEAEDIALVKGKVPTKESLLSFCNKYQGPDRGSCISESWPLEGGAVKTAEGLSKICDMENPDQIDRCYEGLFFVAVAEYNFDLDGLKTFCSGFDPARKSKCLSDVAARLIETDYANMYKAVDVCNYASPTDADNQCYNTLVFYSTFNFHKGSPEFYQFCNAMSDPWKEKCLGGYSS